MSGNFVAVGEEADVQQEGDLDAHEKLVDEPPEEEDDGNVVGSDGEDEDEDEDPEDVGEMDLEGWDAVEKFPFKDSKAMIGATIAYKFDGRDGGWARGTVKSLARTGPNAGMYGVKFVSEQLIRFLELRECDYDTDDIWVQIKKAN